MVDVSIPVPKHIIEWDGSFPRPASDPRKLAEAVDDCASRLGDAKRPILIGGVELYRERAERDFRRATVLNPQNARAWNNLGVLLKGQGRDKEAVAAYARAIRVDPSDARSWTYKGNAHLRLGQTRDAVQCWEEAIRADPRMKDTLQPLIDKYKT